MPFTLIKGVFKPKAGVPDGDSVRFLANDLSVWNLLEGRPVKLGTGAETKNTAQLRFEGIDAIEKGAIQPLATEARNNMFNLIGFDKLTNPEPTGYILARMTDDLSGRPICFVFKGKTATKDGAEVFLTGKMLRASVNYRQAAAGYAYPLYYNTLFAALRNEFDAAIKIARENHRGYWPTDKTQAGVIVKNHDALKSIPPIWPKVWRRLDAYLRTGGPLANFKAFLAEENERIDVLSIMEERGLQDLVEVKGNRVRLLEPPENLRVVAQAGDRQRP